MLDLSLNQLMDILDLRTNIELWVGETMIFKGQAFEFYAHLVPDNYIAIDYKVVCIKTKCANIVVKLEEVDD